MARADVLQWVQDLAYFLADADAIDPLFDEVVTVLGEDATRAWFANFTLTAAGVDEEIHQVPVDLVRILAIFYEDTMLSWESKRSMEALDDTWRQRRHTPVAYITDDVDDRYIRLWPPADFDCRELGWLYTRTLDATPAVMNFPLAFLVLAREFSRESNHRDLPFAEACDALAARMLQMVAT